MSELQNNVTVQFHISTHSPLVLASVEPLFEQGMDTACHWLPRDTGHDTVEHFIPKSIDASKAYDWSNFRLVCGRLNGRKGKYQDVVDLFLVAQGMFEIHFPTLDIVEASTLVGQQHALAKTTIVRLKLNDARCTGARMEWLRPYIEKQFSLAFLRTNAPFLASEISRPKLAPSKLKRVMKGIV